MLAKARRDAQALLVEPPEILGRASDTAGLDAIALQEAWGGWAGLREAADDCLIEQQLEEEHHNLAAAADSFREQAAAELGRLEEAWRPLVDALRSWLPTARDAARASRVVPHLRRAEKWLNSETDLIRAERFGPIAKRASEVWETLKQNSSVTLDQLKLEGSATQRHLVLDVSVDGTDCQALGVMSQGEIHSLALSLFLPRVLLPESPLRIRRDRRSGAGDGPGEGRRSGAACSPWWRRSGRFSSSPMTSDSTNRFAGCRSRHGWSK